MRRHAGPRAGGSLHVAIGEARQVDEAEGGPPLTWPEDPTALPFLDAQGNLVIPTRCPLRFRWWQGGQALSQTQAELAG